MVKIGQMDQPQALGYGNHVLIHTSNWIAAPFKPDSYKANQYDKFPAHCCAVLFITMQSYT